MSMLKVFKSNQDNIQYLLKSGKSCGFVGNTFATDDPVAISELMAEIVNTGIGKSKHPMFYVDENELEVDSEALSPVAILEAKLRAKILAEMAAANNPANDRGNSVQGAFGLSVNNSQKVEDAADGVLDPEVAKQLELLKEEANKDLTPAPTAELGQASVATVKDLTASGFAPATSTSAQSLLASLKAKQQ